MHHTYEKFITTPVDMEAAGAEIARQLCPGQVVYLKGEVGAGKTTLVRGILKALGQVGSIKSPTYTLVEEYTLEIGQVCQLKSLQVCHLDCYRLLCPEELEGIGIWDYCHNEAILLIEWPERGVGHLPKPDYVITLTILSEGRQLLYEYDS